MRAASNVAILITIFSLGVFSCSHMKEADFSEKGMYDRVLKSLRETEKYEGRYMFVLAPPEFLDALDSAETAIDEYLFFYPRGEHAPFVSLKGAEHYDAGMRQQFDIALERYGEVIEKFPGSNEAKTASKRLEFLRDMFTTRGTTPREQ